MALFFCPTFNFTLLQLFYMFYALLSQDDSDVSPTSPVWKVTFFEVANCVIYSLIFCLEIYNITFISHFVVEEADKLSAYIHRTVFFNADIRFIQCVSDLNHYIQIIVKENMLEYLGAATFIESPF